MLALIVVLIKFDIGFTSDGLPSFSSFTEILSPPVAFLGLNLSMIFETLLSSVSLKLNASFFKLSSLILFKLG